MRQVEPLANTRSNSPLGITLPTPRVGGSIFRSAGSTTPTWGSGGYHPHAGRVGWGPSWGDGWGASWGGGWGASRGTGWGAGSVDLLDASRVDPTVRHVFLIRDASITYPPQSSTTSALPRTRPAGPSGLIDNDDVEDDSGITDWNEGTTWSPPRITDRIQQTPPSSSPIVHRSPPSVKPDQDGRWGYLRQYEGQQYLPQQPYHIQYQPLQQQLPTEPYRQQQLPAPHTDLQLRSPHAVQPQVRFTPTRPQSHPTAPTSPLPHLHSPISDSSDQLPLPQRTGKGTVRQPYHPTPPRRSEWVMRVDNVPSGITIDDLREFFGKPPDPPEGATEQNTDVSYIPLIARSNCASVSFDTEAHLTAAITRFSGRKIRPDDLNCPNLVCRVHRKTDDSRAGVGSQRGAGTLAKLVQERKQKVRIDNKSPVDDVTQGTSNLSLTSDEEGGGGGDEDRSFERSSGSGSGSLASTKSSVLTQMGRHTTTKPAGPAETEKDQARERVRRSLLRG